MENLLKNIESLREDVIKTWRLLDIDGQESRMRELKREMSRPDFWNDQKKAVEIGKKYEELNKLIMEYQQMYQQSMMEIERYKLKLFKKIIGRIKEVTNTIAVSEGFDIVLLKVEDVMTEGSVVLFGASSVDLTDKVIRQMNKE